MKHRKRNLLGMARLYFVLVPALLFFFAGTGVAALVDNSDGTVTDTLTCLQWQQATMDVTGDGVADIMTWQQAIAESENLTLAGHSDWRLPDIFELRSIADYSRSNPSIDFVVFPGTVSSYYWSSTSYASSTSSAWRVDFYSGGGSGYGKPGIYYARAVRGGQCKKILDHLEISFSSSAQQPAVPFPVTVTARKADGSVRTDLTGYVELASILGRTNPERVYLVLGQWGGNVTLFNPGTGALSAAGLGLYGSSVPVAVGSSGSCTASITGRVIDLKDDVVYQATVQLLDINDQVLATVQTDLNGLYDFGAQTCGTYHLNISKDTATETGLEVVTYDNNQGVCQTHRLSINGGTQGTPVILVPGMLGSSKSWTSVYPKLSKKKGKHNLHIHARGHTGFKKLQKDLEAVDYTVFTSPWDWRMTVDEAVEEYLKPKINEALKKSTTGKVHIVAHSMGGLVVRSLIQGSQTWADKIDRFAMVGTPNLGSANAYYLWEGGDPKLIDDISDSGIGSSVNFYSNSLQNLWEESYGFKDWKNSKHKEIREFIHDKGPSLLELMSTEEFLNGSRATSGENWNTALSKLNRDPNRFRMSPSGAGNTVQTGLFIGKSVDTVTVVKVKTPHYGAELWQDGKPHFPKRSSLTKGSGDGTVPFSSAVWPQTDVWAKLLADSTTNNHGSLVKGYISKITEFLNTGAVLAAASTDRVTAAAAVEPEAPLLSLATSGTVRLDVVDPVGSHAGIDPVSGDSLQDIAGSSISFNGDDGEVGIENPVNGTYDVVLFGAADRSFFLDIGYMDASGSEYNRFQGYYGSGQIAFQVKVNKTATLRVTIVPPAVSPANLQANPTGGTGAETTTLTWDASTETGVNGYNVYSVTETAPYFARIATVAVGTTGYATTDPAKPDTDNDGYTDYEEIYAGSDPLDPRSVPTPWRSFSWPMFLPAMTGK